MKWSELIIYVESENIEILTNELNDIGFTGFIIEDKNDFLEFIESGDFDVLDDEVLKLKDVKSNVKIYVSENSEKEEKINAVISLIEALKNKNIKTTLKINHSNINEDDWADNFKQFFRPFEVGKNLVVKPSYEDYENKENKIILTIDPGFSFGTGMHETTKLCLISLEKYLKDGFKVLDVGCGSGILSVASEKLGASKVIATDIDENAIIATNSAIKMNNLKKIKPIKTDLANGLNEEFDIIVSNIFAGVLKELFPYTNKLLKDGGLFITSGIIDESLDSILKTYDKYGYKILEKKNIGQWHLVIGKK